MITVRVNQERPVVSTVKWNIILVFRSGQKEILVQLFSFTWTAHATRLKDVKSCYYVAISFYDCISCMIACCISFMIALVLSQTTAVLWLSFLSGCAELLELPRSAGRLWVEYSFLFPSLIFAVCALAFWFFTSQWLLQVFPLLPPLSLAPLKSHPGKQKIKAERTCLCWKCQNLWEHASRILSVAPDVKCSNFNEKIGKGSDLALQIHTGKKIHLRVEFIVPY